MENRSFPLVSNGIYSYYVNVLFITSFTIFLGCNPYQKLQFQSKHLTQDLCSEENGNLHDGRFSLGANGDNLTYSWFGDSATWATSHFVVRLHSGIGPEHDVFASNNPLTTRGSSHKPLAYLTGDLQLSTGVDAEKSQIAYEFLGVQIRQELTPVRHSFKELKKRKHHPAFYKVTYTLTNTNPNTQKIGFQSRLDPQLRHADSCVLEPLRHYRHLAKIRNVLMGMPDEVNPKVKNFVLSRKKVAKKFNSIRIHEQKKVDKKSAMGFIYLGKKNKNIQPAQVQLGSWQEQRKELWNFPSARGNTDDSGVILEWAINLAGGETKEISYYYGQYHPGWGKRVFNGLVRPEGTVQLAHQQPVNYLEDNYLRVDQDSAWVGDSVQLSWYVSHNECCLDKLDQLRTNVDSLRLYEGTERVIAGCEDVEYFMNLRIEKSKVFAQWTDSLHAIYPYPRPIIPPNKTGLFTMGVKEKSLMFGYPYPSTTSHFILRTKGVEGGIHVSHSGTEEVRPTIDRTSLYASNDREVADGIQLTLGQYLPPKYPQDIMQWARGYPDGKPGNLVFPILKEPLGIDSLFLEQRIIPCDTAFQALPLGEKSAYYRVDYLIRNVACGKTQEFDLNFILDPKLSRDERGLISSNGVIYDPQKSIVIPEPSRFQIAPTNDPEALPLDIVFGIDGTPKPDTVFNTLWQAQRRRVEGVMSDELSILNDRALFIKWGTDTLAPGQKAEFSFVIGSELARETDLLYAKREREKAFLWFDYDKDVLIKGEIDHLRKVFNRSVNQSQFRSSEGTSGFSHIVLEGFTGSLGSNRYNKGLAQRRLNHIIRWLTDRGVPRDRILTKINGEYYANNEPPRQRIRNGERVVLMKVY